METSIGEGINEPTRIVIEDNYEEDDETKDQGINIQNFTMNESNVGILMGFY